MINLVTLKDTFLEDAEVLILGTQDDDELKKHLEFQSKYHYIFQNGKGFQYYPES